MTVEERSTIPICLGNVIIGSVEGSRVAGKNLKNNKLAKVEVNVQNITSLIFRHYRAFSIQWSPDSRLLLFGFARGEIHIYDAKLNYIVSALPFIEFLISVVI